MAKLLATGERLFPEELAREYRAAGLWSDLTTGAELHLVATRFGDRPAVASLSATLTHSELDERTDRLAAGLMGLGLDPGDPVLFQMGNEIETVVAWYGCLKAGLVPIASLPNHGSYEISQLTELTGARAHFVQADYRTYDLPSLARRIREQNPSIEVLVVARGEPGPGGTSFEELIASQGAASAREQVARLQEQLDPDGIAFFQLSGGSTGAPKIIPHSHSSYVGGTRAWARHWGWDEHVVTLHTWPIVHNAGLMTALQPALLAGGCCVISSSNDPDDVLRAIEEHGVRVLTVSPHLLASLRSRGDHGYDLSSVQHLYGMNDEATMAEAEQLLGGRARAQFGMGEGSLLASAPDAGADARHSTSGAPMEPQTHVRVLAPGTEDEVPAGEVGELVIRGPFVIRRYFRAPDLDRQLFTSDGFLRTGDLACSVDIDGVTHYRIVGRLKDNIVRGGEKFMATELEGLLLAHPDIAQVAVVAAPDERLGERACAFVVPSDGADPPDVVSLAAWLAELGVSKFKWPERVEVLDSMPVTAIGKHDKALLREQVAAGAQPST